MTDIAQLGYAVDSSGLARGTAALDKHTAAAVKSESATAKFERQTEKLAMSQRQLAMANRQLPMQFTDIAVSLQAGMSPMQVLLQQGTQIKDMYGGIGPALRASAGYIMGLVNPATLAAGAIVGLAIAYSQLEERQNAIDRSLIRTGRYTEKYADQLGKLAEEMDDISGVTARSASKAIAEVSAVGSFTDEQLRIAARAAETWRAATGDAVNDIVKQFEKIKKDPIESLLALNREYTFLTESQLSNIDTLKEQGREQDAVTEGFRAFAEMLETRAPQMEAQVGAISGTFRGLGRAGADAWDTIVTASDSSFEQLINNAARYGTVMGRLFGLTAMGLRGTGGSGNGPDFSNVSTSQVVDSDEIERERKAQKEWDQLRVSNLSKAEKLEEEIQKIRDIGLKSGRVEAEIEKQIAQARARYKESLPKGGRKASETDPTDALIKRLREQIALNEAQLESEDRLTATERMMVQIRTELERIGAKGSATNKALIQSLLEQASATDKAVQAAERQKQVEEALSRLRERTGLAEQNQRRANEVDLIGMREGGEAADMLRRQLDLHRWYEDQVVELRRQAAREKRDVTSAEEQELKDSLQRQLDAERAYQEERRRLMGDWSVGASKAFQDYIDRANDVAGQTNQIFSNAFQGLEDVLTDFFTTGKADWKGYLDQVNAEIMRFIIRQQLSKWMQSMMGGGSGDTAFGASSFSGNGGGWVSSFLGALFGGNRAYGGDVRGDRLYRVGEGDRPELLNMGRKGVYLIPGDQGRVEPISESAQSNDRGGDVYVTVPADGIVDRRSRQTYARDLGREIQKSGRNR